MKVKYRKACRTLGGKKRVWDFRIILAKESER